MNKFRSLTPSSRARRRREEEAAAEEATAKPFQSYQRPSSSHSGKSRSSNISMVSAGETSEPDNSAIPPIVTDRRRNYNHMSPASQKSVAFFDEQDGETASTRPPSVGSQGLRSTGNGSNESYETDATSVHTGPALQSKGHGYEYSILEPVLEDDPASYDLVHPPQGLEGYERPTYSLETRSEQIYSTDHLQAIFDDPKLLRQFTSFLGTHRPTSLPVLIYYLDALKALAALKYSNAVAEALGPLTGHEWSNEEAAPSRNSALEARAKQAFDVLVREDLPAYVTYTWVRVASTAIKRRITGTLPPHMREQSEGLAEVFCLTDPSRSDNPIVFSSEEFHRTTQYGVNYVIGRNCRFLQGPRTNRDSTRRLREAIRAGKDVCETFVNYRRDGSPFMNLLMCAPLRDSRGNLRYFIGAQIDVSNLVKECTELEGVQRVIAKRAQGATEEPEDEFQVLTQMFNQAELDIVRKSGGTMHRQNMDGEDDDAASTHNWHRPRLLLNDSGSPKEPEDLSETPAPNPTQRVHGKLIGVYQNYLLVRPYPSLRILFASPSLRVPGMLQSPFMNRIGSSDRVKDELVAAFAEGRGVTAKIRWVSKHEDEGRNRWIHCTPLHGSSGQIGVWMVVIVDDENSKTVRRFREAPPVPRAIGTRGASANGLLGDASDREGRRVSMSSLTIEDRLPHGRTATMTGARDEFDFRV